MASIDDKIVNLKFNNDQFIQGIQASMSLLAKFKQSLDFAKTKNNAQELQTAVDNVNLDSLANSNTRVSASFSAMGAVALGILANISSRAVDTGLSLTKALTIQSAIDGFKEYEMNIGSVQTILANTASKGSTIKDVNHTLDDLNNYADQTIYSFGEMTRNIGTFTAAGVDLDKSAISIKGIANLAAMSGSNSQQAAGAMYQLSQAIAANKVGLIDWNSVVNAGMGGAVFQEALFETGKAMKTLKGVDMNTTFEQWTKSGNSFRDSLQEGWITGEVLTNTLGAFTQDVDEAHMKSIGYSDDQIKKFKELANTATQAATVSKTFSDVIGTLKESVGSGWAETWRTVIGDFEESKVLFTGLGNFLNGIAGNFSKSRNEMLKSWKDMGGRDDLITGLANSGKFLHSVLTAIGAGFRDAFPVMTAERLKGITESFRRFSETLKLNGESADNIKRIFRGVFSIFSIAGQIIGSVISAFAKLFGVTLKGSGGFLGLLASIGDLIYGFDQMLKKSGFLSAVFSGLATVLSLPIKGIQLLASGLSSLFSSGHSGESFFSSLGQDFESFGGVIERFIAKIKGFAGKISETLAPAKDAIGNIFGGLDGYDLFVGGALTGIFLMVRKLVQDGFSLIPQSITEQIGDVIENISGVAENAADLIESVTDSLKVMQTDIKANIILKIAAALTLLAISLKLLSGISTGDLTRSLVAIGVALTQLMTGLLILTKMAGFKGLAALPILASSLILISGAVAILATAIKSLSSLSWDELARGLTGIAGALLILLGALRLMPGGGMMVATGAGLILIAGGLGALSYSVREFSSISWGDMAKGLAGIAGSLLALGGGLKLMPGNLVATGAGLLLISGSVKVLADSIAQMGALSIGDIAKGLATLGGTLVVLGLSLNLISGSTIKVGAMLLLVAGSVKVLSSALQDMGGMDIGSIGKALLALGGALVIMGAALTLIPANSIVTGAALLLVTFAIDKLAQSLQVMGGMSMAEIGKSLLALAGSLTILAAALYVMTGTLAGSAALLVASLALQALSTALVTLGGMSLAEIGTALLALAGALVVLGGGAALLTPLLPSLIAFAAAIGILGVGALAAGAGIMMMGQAFQILSGNAAPALENLAKFIEFIPMIMGALGEGIVDFVRTAIDSIMPLIPEFVTAGSRMLIELMSSMAAHAPAMAATATNLIVTFMTALEQHFPTLSNKGADMIISLVNSIAGTLRNKGPELGAAGANLGIAIIQGMAGAIASGASTVMNAAASMAASALAAAKNKLGIKSPSREFKKVGRDVDRGLAVGIREHAKEPISEARTLAEDVLGTFGMVQDVMTKGDFNGAGLFDEDDPFVNDLFAIRENLLALVSPLSSVSNRVEDFSKSFDKLGILSNKSNLLNLERVTKAFSELSTNTNKRYSSLGFVEALTTGIRDLSDISQVSSELLRTGRYSGGAKQLLSESSEFVKILKDIHSVASDLPKAWRAMRPSMRDFGFAYDELHISDIPDTLSMIRDLLMKGDFNGSGVFDEDHPIVGIFLDARKSALDFFDLISKERNKLLDFGRGLAPVKNIFDNLRSINTSGLSKVASNVANISRGFRKDIEGFEREFLNPSISSVREYSEAIVSEFVTTRATVEKETFHTITAFTKGIRNHVLTMEREFVEPISKSFTQFVTKVSTELSTKRALIVREVTILAESIQHEVDSKLVQPAITWGHQMVARIQKGVTEAYLKYVDPIVSAAKKAQDQINKRIQSEYNKHIAPYVNIGRNMVEGLRLGIEGNSRLVSGAVRGMSEGALRTSRSVLGIHSPSREFERIGVYSGEGFALGIDKGGETVQKSTRKMLKDVMDTISDGVDIAGGILDVFAKGVEVATKLAELFTPKEVEEPKTSTDKVADKIERNADKIEDQTPKLEKAADAQTAVADKVEGNTEKIKKAEEEQTESLNALGQAYLEFAKAGIEVGKGVVDIAASLNDVVFNIWNSVDRMSRRMNDHGRAIGTSMTVGITNAMNHGRREVSWATDDMAEYVVDRAERRFGVTGSKQGVFYDIGKKNAKGLAAGLRNWLNLDISASDKTTRRVFKEVVDEYLQGAGKVLDGVLKVVSGLSAAANVADKLGIDWVRMLNLEGLMTGMGGAQDIIAMGMSQITSMFGPGVAAAIPGIGIGIAAILAWVSIVGWDRMKEIGRTLIGGVLDGIGSMFGSFGEAIHRIFNMDNIFDIAEWFDIGRNLVKGLVGGIFSSIGSVFDGVKNLAYATVDGFKRILGINSPSRVFATMGMYLDQGLAKGISKHSAYPISSVTEMGKDIRSSLKEALVNIDWDAIDELSLNPVITPIIDMSLVRRDAASISGMFGGLNVTSSAPQAFAISRAEQIAIMDALKASTEKKENQSIVFNQYNQSPKSLSTIDIYRNTHSQLAAAERRISGATV